MTAFKIFSFYIRKYNTLIGIQKIYMLLRDICVTLFYFNITLLTSKLCYNWTAMQKWVCVCVYLCICLFYIYSLMFNIWICSIYQYVFSWIIQGVPKWITCFCEIGNIFNRLTKYLQKTSFYKCFSCLMNKMLILCITIILFKLQRFDKRE